MASEIDDGGAAFAFPSDLCGHYPGMSLRDYFAAKALPWALANIDVSQPWKFSAAMAAYEIADAMIAARNHTPAPSGSPNQ